MSNVLQISNRYFLHTLLGILILLIGGKGHSQNLSGRVLNDQGQALDGATILLYEADSTTMRGFSISDSLGNWQINKPVKANMLITAAYLGYATQYIPIDTELLSRDTIVIVLRSSAQLLTEVEVRAKPLRIVVKGDTLSFDAKAFLREGDQTLGDLLGNMPGIEYSKSGEILYNNKRIDKLLLEGRDILADQHKLSAEGVQAQDVKTINIIEHYRSFSEQYLPFKSNKVAMDIKLTDEAKFRINGDVELLAGHESKYEAKTNVYRVGEQSGMTSFIRANNIGEAVMSSGDFLSIKGSLYHALNETKGDLSQLIPAGFTPSMDVQQNYDNVILFNLEKDKGKRQKSRITSMVNYAKRNQQSTVLQNFEDRNLLLNGIKNKETIFPYVYSKWTMDKLFENKNGRISFEIPAYADLSKNTQTYDGDVSLQASHNFYTNRTKTFNVAPKISFYKSPSKKHSYYWDVDLLLENKDHNLFLSQDGEFQTEINQANRNQKGKAGLKLGYYRFLENWELNGEFRSSYILTDWRIESKETPLYDTDFHHSILNFNSNVNFEYEKNKWMAKLKFNADFNHHRLDTLQKQNFVYSPSL
ncbi:carboxypeptidase-like regulatory domain-containing protein [Membranihabitans marinus]|uniref:carboxypeptidase-like regulatory domain-containing protein n=1 Tax=Membranihabitans marinus TaxID=1227546 RepID=UPI001F2431F9|nr:carboxypeptidase-like regulatory domain-containing protein [Membranihabitans marinus]